MKPDTDELLSKLRQMDWFHSAGTSSDATFEVELQEDWPQAIDICCLQTSKDARLEARNQLSVSLFKSHRDDFQLWNSKVSEIKPRVERLISDKLILPSIFSRDADEVRGVLWQAIYTDLLGLCIAREYRGLVRSRYYDLVEHWYLAGHFPCGWIGEVPEDMEGAFQVGKIAVL